MKPILAIVPPLSPTYLWPLVLVTLLIGTFWAWRAKNAMPIFVVGGAALLLFLWSRLPNGVSLHSYGLFLVAGFFLSTYLASLEAKRRGLDPNIILDAAMPLLLVSILLCRILYFIIYPDQWRGLGEFVQIWNGGLSFHGAIVGALGTLAYFAWRYKVKFGTLCDIVSPGVFAGYAVGRIGCFMNGCCYGHPTDLPWAVQFPSEVDRSVLTPPCHPAQLYATFLGLAFFALIWSVRAKPQFNRFTGQLTLFFLALYAIERGIVEFFRKGATAPLAYGIEWLTLAQQVSLIALATIAALWILLLRRANRQEEVEDAMISVPPSVPPSASPPSSHVSAS